MVSARFNLESPAVGVDRQVVGITCIVMFETCGIKPLRGMYGEWELERYMKNTDIFNMGSFISLFEV